MSPEAIWSLRRPLGPARRAWTIAALSRLGRRTLHPRYFWFGPGCGLQQVGWCYRGCYQ